jgi:Galactose oxidase, central domain
VGLPMRKVLIVGGSERDTRAELFDPATSTFSSTGSMTTPRSGATTTLLANGKVLVAGGLGEGTSFLPILDTAELYDPPSGTFQATGNMIVQRVRNTATSLDDGRVLITGGIDTFGGGGAAVASVELYDPATGTFLPTGGMHTDRADHTATLLADGSVLIAGGWNGHRADAADDPPWDPLFAELYKPPSTIFNATDSMSTTRIGHAAIQLQNGRVLVLGGIPAIQNIHEQPPSPAYAELYDPSTGHFSPLATPAIAKQMYSSTLLNNGEVLLVGGEERGTTVSTAQLLDPGTGALTATGGLATARSRHTATRLNDGRVLVVGGSDINGSALASAEIYK